MVQMVAIAATWIYTFLVTVALARIIDAFMGLRVRDEEESVGLDLSQHGEGAYMYLVARNERGQ